jgi:peptidoglycan/LPS O-acetylase OafA/YrhL
MIQRKQTLWLLIAATLSLLSLKLPVYAGNMLDEAGTKHWKELTAASTLLLTLAAGAVAVIALVAIFLYKNRPLQMRVVLVNLLLSLGLLVLFFLESRNYPEGGFSITALLPLVVPVLLVVAIVGIRKDERLMKSLDRLR